MAGKRTEIPIQEACQGEDLVREFFRTVGPFYAYVIRQPGLPSAWGTVYGIRSICGTRSRM